MSSTFVQKIRKKRNLVKALQETFEKSSLGKATKPSRAVIKLLSSFSNTRDIIRYYPWRYPESKLFKVYLSIKASVSTGTKVPGILLVSSCFVRRT